MAAKTDTTSTHAGDSTTNTTETAATNTETSTIDSGSVAGEQTSAVIKSDGVEQPANIAPATEFDPSGAPVQSGDEIDYDHPAVDNDPRSGTSIKQNHIDFNDPALSGAEAVERNLRKSSEA